MVGSRSSAPAPAIEGSFKSTVKKSAARLQRAGMDANAISAARGCTREQARGQTGELIRGRLFACRSCLLVRHCVSRWREHGPCEPLQAQVVFEFACVFEQ